MPALINRAMALVQLGRNEEALANCEKALARDAKDIGALNTRGLALKNLGRYQEALTTYQAVLAVHPQHPAALHNLATVLSRLGRDEEALASVDKILLIAPDDPGALMTRGDILTALDRSQEAIESYQDVVRLNPDNELAKWKSSMPHFDQGLLCEGWSLNEHRWASPTASRSKPYVKPRWDGRRVDGNLLVWGEQGLGDQILHASMLSDLRDYARKVIIEAEPRLVPLFERSFPGMEIVPLVDALYRDLFDAHIPLASLGQYWCVRIGRPFNIATAPTFSPTKLARKFFGSV